jgi:hypothetical protein
VVTIDRTAVPRPARADARFLFLFLFLLLALIPVQRAAAQAPPGNATSPPPPPASGEPAVVPKPTAFLLLGPPAGAEVTIDGKSVGTTPLPPKSEITPGPHQLQLTKRGYTSFTREFTAYLGRTVSIEIEMVPTHGLLRVRASESEAQVYVDEELKGEAPIELDLRPGPHQILVKRANFRDQSFSVTAVAGEELEREVRLEINPEQLRKERASHPIERRWYTRWWVWTLAAVGAVGIATAIIVPTVLSQRSDCDKLGGEVCFPIQLGTPPTSALTTGLTVRF